MKSFEFFFLLVLLCCNHCKIISLYTNIYRDNVWKFGATSIVNILRKLFYKICVLSF